MAGRSLAMLLAAAGPAVSADCNQNGKPDDEELATGRSADCNANEVPDECDLTVPQTTLAFTRRIAPAPARGALLVADLDGDGDEDAAVSDGQEAIWLLLENREGILQERFYSTAQRAVRVLAAGDADSDGDLDIVSMSHEEARILRNDGSWRFTPRHVLDLKDLPGGAATGDLDGNGTMDLVLLGPFALTTFLGSAQGEYRLAQTVQLHSEPRSIVLSDLDGDGDADMATANRLDSVSVSLNDGRGALALARNFAAGLDRRSLAAADLDGDADLDLVTAGERPGANLLHNRGDGRFLPAQSVLEDPNGLLVVIADLNGDGAPDVLLGLDGPGRLVGVLGGERGALDPPLRAGFPGGMVGLAALEPRPGGLPEILALENGHGYLAAYRFATSHLSADHQGDGVPDECQGSVFVRGDVNVSGGLELTDGIFLLQWLFSGGEPSSCPESADFNNDGKLGVTDILGIMAYWNQWGPPPAAPGFECGFDTDPPGSPGDLGCSGSCAF